MPDSPIDRKWGWFKTLDVFKITKIVHSGEKIEFH